MKKGFTLIELLAVIVILAIIALIAVPTITGIVEKAKKGGAEQSANGYNDAINKQIALNQMDSNDENDINKGFIDAPFDEKYNLKVKGQTPTKGWVEVLKDGVYRYSLVIGEYVVTYDGENTTVIKGTEPAEKPDFASQSWETIIANVRSGNTSNYHIGDTKEVDMGEFGKHNVRIANMSTPSECNSEEFSQTACGFVLEFEDVIISRMMNSSGKNTGGWPASSLREYVNNKIYNSLPSDLKSGIINTMVISSHGSTIGISENNFISNDKLYLFSTKEIWGKEGTTNIVKCDSAEEETRQLDYYKESGVTTSNFSGAIKKRNGSNNNWWLRSVVKTNNLWVYAVKKNGGRSDDTGGNEYYVANNSLGVSPAFRIG